MATGRSTPGYLKVKRFEFWAPLRALKVLFTSFITVDVVYEKNLRVYQELKKCLRYHSLL